MSTGRSAASSTTRLENTNWASCYVLWPQGHMHCIPNQGGVTPINPIVTAATALVNLYTKEGVESLRILPYTSVNVRVVSGQWLKFNAVNGQSLKISVVNGQNAENSWSKFWLCGRSCDYRVYGSDIPLSNGLQFHLGWGVNSLSWTCISPLTIFPTHTSPCTHPPPTHILLYPNLDL